MLEGGGAKGAYQFGVLEAFQEAGIKFDVVAGSSVGALNAALWSGGEMSWGRDFWWSMSPERVYPLSRFNKFLLFCTGWLVLAPLIAVLVLIRVTISFDTFCSGLGSRWKTYVVVAIANILLWVGIIGGLWVAFSTKSDLSFLLFMVVSSMPYFAGRMALNLFRGHPERAGADLRWLLLILVVLPSLCASGWLIERYMPHDLQSSDLIGYVAYMCVIVPALAALYLVYRAVQSASILDNSPLKTSIEELVSRWDLRTTTFVTLAEIREDGDNVKELIPVYVELGKETREDQVRALLATCALPLGLVPNTEFHGIRMIDGGAVDNCPILPVVTKNCHEIVIVHVRPSINTSELEERRWCERLIVKLWFAGDRALPEQWPYIRRVAPQRKLGGFLGGTLNFRSKYTPKLMKQGKEEGILHLKQWGLYPQH